MTNGSNEEERFSQIKVATFLRNSGYAHISLCLRNNAWSWKFILSFYLLPFDQRTNFWYPQRPMRRTHRAKDEIYFTNIPRQTLTWYLHSQFGARRVIIYLLLRAEFRIGIKLNMQDFSESAVRFERKFASIHIVQSIIQVDRLIERVVDQVVPVRRWFVSAWVLITFKVCA